MEFADDVNAWG